MEYSDIIKKLIGNVRPQGNTEADEEAMKNLKEMCKVTKELLIEIDMALCQRPFAKEHSILKVQEVAKEFLIEVGFRTKD